MDQLHKGPLGRFQSTVTGILKNSNVMFVFDNFFFEILLHIDNIQIAVKFETLSVQNITLKWFPSSLLLNCNTNIAKEKIKMPLAWFSNMIYWLYSSTN